MEDGAGAPLLQQLRNAGNIGNAAGLIVHQHETHQDRIRLQGFLHRFCRDAARGVRIQESHRPAFRLQLLQAFQHRLMLRL